MENNGPARHFASGRCHGLSFSPGPGAPGSIPRYRRKAFLIASVTLTLILKTQLPTEASAAMRTGSSRVVVLVSVIQEARIESVGPAIRI